MPKDKDLKRLVRARMEKTGESYTAARAHILKNDPPPLPDDYEKLAGMGDAAVRKATGRTWPEWAGYLDAEGAHGWEHRAIAAHLGETFDFSGWWAQMVTVAYERFRGLRDFGQRRGGGYDVNKSKTVPVGVDALWSAFDDEALRDRWLTGIDVHFHRATPVKSMRGKAPDGTRIDVYFTEKGPGKSSVSVQHQGHPDRDTADAMKAFWGERLEALKAELSE